MPRRIVRGQSLAPELIRRAHELRKQQTPEENILWQELRGNRLGIHFRRQQPIGGYIADFYCHSAALVVEVDGSPHQRQAGYDRLRDQTFATLGIRTLRFTNMEIRKNLDLVLTTIGSAVRIT